MQYLKHSQQALPKAVKIWTRLLFRRFEIKFATENLHAEQSENDDEQEQKQQQRCDWLNWVEERRDEVGQRSPISDLRWKMKIKLIMNFMNFGTYFVTLKTLKRRTHRSTEIPSGGMMFVWNRTISPILPITTKQSKRLNSDTKYPWKPKLYILRNISIVKSATKNMLVYSVMLKSPD